MHACVAIEHDIFEVATGVSSGLSGTNLLGALSAIFDRRNSPPVLFLVIFFVRTSLTFPGSCLVLRTCFMLAMEVFSRPVFTLAAVCGRNLACGNRRWMEAARGTGLPGKKTTAAHDRGDCGCCGRACARTGHGTRGSLLRIVRQRVRCLVCLLSPGELTHQAVKCPSGVISGGNYV